MNDDGCGNSRYKGDNLDDEEGSFVLKEEIEGECGWSNHPTRGILLYMW